LKINIKLLAGLFRGGMLQSLALLYAEHALARKSMTTVSAILLTKVLVDRGLCTVTGC